LAQGLRESRLAEATEAALHEGGRLAKATARGKDNARAAIDRGVRRAQRATRHAAERTRESAEAVAETSRRAVAAPPRIGRDLREALSAWAGGFAKGIALYAAAGAIALVALVVLTVGFVVGLDLLLGRPWGAFLVGAAYALAAVAAALAARNAIRKGQRTAQARVEDARREARAIVQPLRRLSRPGRSRPAPRNPR
jgi:hypothetical protein